MTDYLTTDTEIDIGNDMDELLIKVQKLTDQNEELTKLLREKEHEFSQKITETKMENETLKRSNENLESLMKTYKSMSTTHQSADSSDLEELGKLVNNLETKLLLTEQSELNLKRQTQALNMQIRDLKMEVEKLNLRQETEKSQINNEKDPSDFDNLDEETRNMLTELMNENEDLKKEKNEVSEKALNMLTEKELEVMEVREKMDELKKSHQTEITKLMAQIGELKFGQDNTEDDGEGDGDSLNTEEAKVLLEKYKELSDEFDTFKQETEDRERTALYENEKLKRELEMTERTVKANSQEYEHEISKLKNDIYTSECERFQYEKGQQDDDTKNVLFAEIEGLQHQLRNVEESKEKSHFKYKEQMSRLDEDLKELDSANSLLKAQKTEIERELTTLKTNSAKHVKEMQEKTRQETNIKEKENSQLKERIDFLLRESDGCKKDYELLKKQTEKSKGELKELVENSKRVRENHESDCKRWEERCLKLEKRHEDEKSNLEEQVQNLRQKVSLHETRGSFHHKQTLAFKEEQLETHPSQILPFDSEALTSAQNKISSLSEEIHQLNDQLVELKLKAKNFEKFRSEGEFITKENAKLKADISEMKEMYETQIAEMNSKSIRMASDLQTTRRRATSRVSIGGKDNQLTAKQIQVFGELEVTITKLMGESKYMQEKVDILLKELENMKTLRENDVKFLKEEIRAAEDQAAIAKVNLATLAFEKDSELLKYRNVCKKLKLRLQTYGTNNQLAKTKTIPTTNTPSTNSSKKK